MIDRFIVGKVFFLDDRNLGQSVCVLRLEERLRTADVYHGDRISRVEG